MTTVNNEEPGCPGTWKDETRRCQWCDSEFQPEYQAQRFCDDRCFHAYDDDFNYIYDNADYQQ